MWSERCLIAIRKVPETRRTGTEWSTISLFASNVSGCNIAYTPLQTHVVRRWCKNKRREKSKYRYSCIVSSRENNGIKAGNKSFRNVTKRSNIWERRSNIKISFFKKLVALKDSSEWRCGVPWAVNMKTVVFWDVPVTRILLSPSRGFFLHTEEGRNQVLTYRSMEILVKMRILSVGLYACESWHITLNYRCSRTNPEITWM